MLYNIIIIVHNTVVLRVHNLKMHVYAYILIVSLIMHAARRRPGLTERSSIKGFTKDIHYA